MHEQVVLPDGSKIDCIYLSRDVTANIGWLHSVRRLERFHDLTQKKMYEFREPNYLETFTSEVIQFGEHFEVVVAAPSSHPYAKRYKDAVLLYSTCADISDRLIRKGNCAASTVSSFDEFEGEFEYSPRGDESAFISVLIIDDVLGKGNTALHIIQLLLTAGVPLDCKFQLAVPLWPS